MPGGPEYHYHAQHLPLEAAVSSQMVLTWLPACQHW